MNLFNNLKIGVRMLIAFLVIIGSILVMLFYSVKEIRQASFEVGLINVVVMPMLSASTTMLNDWQILSTQIRDAQIAKNDAELTALLNDFDSIVTHFDQQIDATLSLLHDSAEAAGEKAKMERRMIALLGELKERFGVLTKDLKTRIQQGKEDPDAAIRSLEVTKQEIKVFSEELASFGHTSVAESEAMTERIKNFLQQISLVITILAVAVIIISILAGVLVTRSITKPIRELVKMAKQIATRDLSLKVDLQRYGSGSETGELAVAYSEMIHILHDTIQRISDNAHNVNGTAAQLKAASEEVLMAVENQLEVTSSTTGNVEEMGQGMVQVAANAEQTREQATSMLSSVQQGNQMLNSLIDDIDSVAKINQDVATAIGLFIESTHSISQMTQEVRDIADQTNLLALNAAIEAARAGEAGRGFAVVADSVRSLAEKSAESAAKIDQVTVSIKAQADKVTQAIEEGAVVIENSRTHSQEVSGTFETSIGLVKTSVEGIESMTHLIQNQQKVADDVVQDVEKIEKMSEKTHETTQSTSNMAIDLNQLSESLEKLVGTFKLS